MKIRQDGSIEKYWENEPYPYWEIHYYHNGFINDGTGPATNSWFDQRKDNEQHFYFTLRSLISDEHYGKLKKNGVIKPLVRGLVEVIKDVGASSCKVDKYYDGLLGSQTAGGVDIVILEDEYDNFKKIQQHIPPEIWDCLTEKRKIPDYKPSDLPQMMFLAYGSTFIAKTENVDSIVCLDRYTQLSTNEDGKILKIKGNLFLNEGAMIMPSKYSQQKDNPFVGSNTVFGDNCRVHAASIGNNVFIGNNVMIGSGAVISNGCIITEKVKVTNLQKILAGQIITARTPLFLNLLENDGDINLQYFYSLSESRRELSLT